MGEPKKIEFYMASLHAEATARHAAMTYRSQTLNEFSASEEYPKGEWHRFVESDKEQMLAEFEKLAAALGYEITSKLGDDQ